MDAESLKLALLNQGLAGQGTTRYWVRRDVPLEKYLLLDIGWVDLLIAEQ